MSRQTLYLRRKSWLLKDAAIGCIMFRLCYIAVCSSLYEGDARGKTSQAKVEAEANPGRGVFRVSSYLLSLAAYSSLDDDYTLSRWILLTTLGI